MHLDCVRVRVAADVVGRLEHRDVVLAVEARAATLPGDAGADDRNLHGCLRRPRRPASQDRRGHRPQVPHDAERGEQLQAVPGQVDFPPVEALARGAGIAMVVVVPALAERDEREQGIVARVVARRVAARAPAVGQRVDDEGRVEQHHGRDAEAPHQQLPRAGAQRRVDGLEPCAERPQRHEERGRHGHVVAVEPAELRIAREVADQARARGEVLARQEPAHVAPEEAVLPGRVDIFRPVGVRVVMAMVRGPPQRSALHGGGAEHGEHELPAARGAERAMREVAVVEGGDREHAHREEGGGEPRCKRAPAGPDRAEAAEMQRDERDDPRPVDAARVAARRVALGRAVDPAAQRDGEAGAHGLSPRACAGSGQRCGTLRSFDKS